MEFRPPAYGVVQVESGSYSVISRARCFVSGPTEILLKHDSALIHDEGRDPPNLPTAPETQQGEAAGQVAVDEVVLGAARRVRALPGQNPVVVAVIRRRMECVLLAAVPRRARLRHQRPDADSAARRPPPPSTGRRACRDCYRTCARTRAIRWRACARRRTPRCASTKARHTSITFNSLRPTRRSMIFWALASVSKCQRSPCLTTGIGNGPVLRSDHQRGAALAIPTRSGAPPRKPSRNARGPSRSATLSPEWTSFSPSGSENPQDRVLDRFLRSAAINASTACSGVAKSSGLPPPAIAGSGPASTASAMPHRPSANERRRPQPDSRTHPPAPAHHRRPPGGRRTGLRRRRRRRRGTTADRRASPALAPADRARTNSIAGGIGRSITGIGRGASGPWHQRRRSAAPRGLAIWGAGRGASGLGIAGTGRRTSGAGDGIDRSATEDAGRDR